MFCESGFQATYFRIQSPVAPVGIPFRLDQDQDIGEGDNEVDIFLAPGDQIGLIRYRLIDLVSRLEQMQRPNQSRW